MEKHLSYLIETSTNPYHNLAVEQALAQTLGENELILYLWQNRKTVVIGRNQNAWAECRVENLIDDGGYIVRRPSGGGAVFHDLGNLNFTFLAKPHNYDEEANFKTIIQALSSFGLAAELSGRNDMTIGGKKFSGNAFTKNPNFHLHHGTLMVAVDQAQLSRYLSVSKLKLASKGIASVASRVVNLSSLNADVNVSSLIGAIVEAFGEYNGQAPQEYARSRLDERFIEETIQTLSDSSWVFGENQQFDAELSERFSWGEITIGLNVQKGKVAAATIYSDALDAAFIPNMTQALQNGGFSGRELSGRTEALAYETPTQRDILKDVSNLLLSIDDGD